jgi:hypothetical protein
MSQRYEIPAIFTSVFAFFLSHLRIPILDLHKNQENPFILIETASLMLYLYPLSHEQAHSQSLHSIINPFGFNQNKGKTRAPRKKIINDKYDIVRSGFLVKRGFSFRKF